MTGHDHHAGLHLAELDRPGPASRSVDRDPAVHQGRCDCDPSSAVVDEGRLVAGHEKMFREHPVGRRLGQGHLRLGNHLGAVLAKPAENRIDLVQRRRLHLHAGVARVGRLFPHADLADPEGAGPIQDFIQHFRQGQRIDDMTPQLDVLGKHRYHLFPG